MLKKLLKTIEKALFPEFSCFVCGREMKNPENGLCEKCAAKIKRIDGNICEKCGMQISDGERFCITCKNTSYVFNKARAAFVFDDISSSLVHQLKFKGKKFIVSLLACEMEKVFNSMDIKPDFIVPIPLAVKKEKKRGFNQSEILAKQLSEKINIPVFENVVAREIETPSQRGLSQKERKLNLQKAFKCLMPEVVKDKTVLIVDDVFTTGTTVNECSKVLLKAKAKQIFVLTALKTHFK